MQDFLLLLFFVGGYLLAKFLGYIGQEIYFATAFLMIGVVLQIVYMLLRKQKIEKKHILTFLVIIVLGSVTLLLKNDIFIKLKPTILNILLAIAFLGSDFLVKENFTKKMFKSILVMPINVWRWLNFAWVVFFLLSALANYYVAINYSNDFYVGFKFWGLVGATIVFLFMQLILLRKFIKTGGGD